MTSTAISSVRSKMAPASCKRRTTCHLVNASTLPWIMLGTGGRSHNTSPMLRRKNGERRHPALTEQAAEQIVWTRAAGARFVRSGGPDVSGLIRAAALTQTFGDTETVRKAEWQSAPST